MNYLIGGSFAKYLKGNANKFKDIDIYISYDSIVPMLEKLSKKGLGLVEHPNNKIIQFSADLGNVDIMVFRKGFRFSTRKIGDFEVLSNRTLKRIYKYAKNAKDNI
jgi:hypothetical protein